MASGRDALKVMRLICHTWQAGYDDSITFMQLTPDNRHPEGTDRAAPLPIALPQARGSFSRLATVVIWNGAFSDQDLLGLSAAPRLSNLYLYCCSGITPALVRTLGAVPALQDLLFCESDIDDSGVGELRNLPKLTGLTLDFCEKLTPGGLTGLHGAPIASLVLDTFLSMDAADLSVLLGLPLTYLGLKNGNLKDGCIAEISSLPLVGLDLTDMNLSDVGLAALGELTLLRDLSLADVCMLDQGITAEGFGALGGLPLTCLDLGNHSGGSGDIYMWLIVDDDFLAVLRNMPLADLCLSQCELITDVGLLHLRNLPLTRLNLENCSLITSNGLAAILPGLPLAVLDLSFCDGIFDADRDPGVLSYLPQSLTDLSLRACYKNLRDSSLLPLKGLKLRRLIVASCHLLTDESLGLFLSMSGSLKRLCLFDCFFSDESLEILRQRQTIVETKSEASYL